MKLNQLIIDSNKTIGKKLALTGIAPIRRYDNGKVTDTIDGYRYSVVMLDNGKGYEKFSVKIAGEKQLDFIAEETQLVVFDGLDIRAYVIDGIGQVSATATGIRLVGKG